MINTMPTKEDILTGTYKKEVYGICKEFRWLVYDYKGERYEISTFSNEINHVARIYCECCNRKFLPSLIKIYIGVYHCIYCIKQIEG